MGGGSETVARSTNHVFYVRYTSSCGIQYTNFGVRKLKPEVNEYGWREAEWDIEVHAYSLDEDENNKLYEAFRELENERSTVSGFDKLTQEQRTLADIWTALKEAEHNIWVWKSRAEDAEKALSALHDVWYNIEERKGKEAEEKVKEVRQ
jgi:hypothetical protein